MIVSYYTRKLLFTSHPITSPNHAKMNRCFNVTMQASLLCNLDLLPGPYWVKVLSRNVGEDVEAARADLTQSAHD